MEKKQIVIENKTKGVKKNIGFFSLTLLSLGSMIGSGIFVLLGPGAGIAGDNLPFSFLIAGFLALLLALIYAELLSTTYPAESFFDLLFNVYGRGILPFIISWLIVLGDAAYGAVNVLGFSYYFHLLLPIPPLYIAIGVVLIFAFLSWRGMERGTNIERIIAVLLFLSLSGFLFLILSEDHIFLDLFKGFSFGGVTSLLAASALIYTAFIGYEDIALVVKKVKDPAKNIPRALISSVVLATLLFFGVSLLGVNLVSPQILGGSKIPLLLIAGKSGVWAEILITAGALIATLSALVTMLLLGSYELRRVAKQGFFGGIFTPLNRWNIPGRALIFITFLVLFLILTNSVKFVAYLGNAVFLVSAILISFAVIQLRKKRPYMERPFRVPFFPWFPLFVAGFCFLILLFVGKEALFAGLIWATVGFFLYLVSWLERERIKWLFWGGFLSFLLFVFLTFYVFFIL